MKNATIIGIVLAVFLIAGAVFTVAGFAESPVIAIEQKVSQNATAQDCPRGCSGNCNGDCSTKGCNCTKKAEPVETITSCKVEVYGCANLYSEKCKKSACGCSK